VHVVSVNVGLPAQTVWRGRTVSTAIFKRPATGPVAVRRLNVDGDRQADLTVHGGPDKAVYAYPAEHYPPWEAELGAALSWGTFGENLTLAGLPLEDELAVGDRLRIGSVELTVTQPRLPCLKLGIRFGDPGMVRRFLASGRTGYYLRVDVEGTLAAGDAVELVHRHPARTPVSEVTRLHRRHEDHAAVRRLLENDALPDDWRAYFRERIARSGSAAGAGSA
jgi:MOSC domain-containing protein YiiM